MPSGEVSAQRPTTLAAVAGMVSLLETGSVLSECERILAPIEPRVEEILVGPFLLQLEATIDLTLTEEERREPLLRSGPSD